MDEVALMQQISEGYTFYFLFDTKSSKKIRLDACVPTGNKVKQENDAKPISCGCLSKLCTTMVQLGR